MMTASRPDGRQERQRKIRWLWGLPLVGLIALIVLSVLASHTASLGALGFALGAPRKVSQATAHKHQAGRTLDSHYLFSPDELRDTYHIAPLISRGFDGRGQTVVVIVSYGNPTLAQDVATFDAAYHLPPANVEMLTPLGSKPWDPANATMAGWTRETEEDVETIHAVAPGAKIVVLASASSQNQGTDGLSDFLQLEQYAVDHHLGNIISMSWGASEASLDTPDGHIQVGQWDTFFHHGVLSGFTFVASSGDHGSTDFADSNLAKLSSTPTTNFPADDPYVTGIGGTTMTPNGTEAGWERSGGGVSRFFPMPAFQSKLAPATVALLGERRGMPDVSALGASGNGLGIYVNGEWKEAWGTSTSAPLWAGLIAIADQMRGKPLGDLNGLLYQVAAAPTYSSDFNDITTGNNTWSPTWHPVPGYQATLGWDAVTGLGTPHVDRLLPDLIEAANQRDNGSVHGGV